MTLKFARTIAGTLGFPSKMPGTSYGLSAKACITGAKLAQVPGTICHSCYALDDRFSWPNPQKAFARRLQGISDPAWIEAMVFMLRRTHAKERIKVDLGNTGVRLQRSGGSRWRYNPSGFHRWHDSGDLQSVEHLAKICEVARRTPQIRHWLPTTELGMVRQYVADGGEIPDNLTIRVSAIWMDADHRRAWPLTSSVFKIAAPEGAHVCPAPQQGHRCMDCRACWSRDIPHVSYAAH